MFTCSKTYVEIPFAHRQWRHEGHCSQIHGHNWNITFEFGCRERDERGFVMDFGDLGAVKEYLERFDHALVLCQDDPKLKEIRLLDCSRIMVVEDASAEGMAKMFFEAAQSILYYQTKGRVWVTRVIVHEDSRNSATCSLPPLP